MTNLVTIQNHNGVAMVSSRIVAEQLDKEHRRILQDCREKLEDGVEFVQSSYINSQNKEQPELLLTKDGFLLLCMNYQGYNDFKRAYIQAFNEMERELANKNPKTYLEALKALVITEEAKLEAERARQIAETKVIQLAPKAKKYDEVISTAKTFSISEISAILGLGYGNKLHTLLVQEGWLDKEHRGAYTVGDMAPDNTFQVALNNYRGHRAEQVRVTTSGFTKIQALLKLRSQF